MVETDNGKQLSQEPKEKAFYFANLRSILNDLESVRGFVSGARRGRHGRDLATIQNLIVNEVTNELYGSFLLEKMCRIFSELIIKNSPKEVVFRNAKLICEANDW